MPEGARPFPPTRGCKAVITGSIGATRWANIIWLFLSGSGEIDHSALQRLADRVAFNYQDAFVTILHHNVLIETIQVVLYAGGDDAFEAVSAPGAAGVRNGQQLPAQVTPCISWLIAPHYRGGHPRTYLPGAVLDDTSGPSSWTGAFVQEVGNSAVKFHNDLEAYSDAPGNITGVAHGIYSFVRAKQWREPPVFYRISGATVDSRIDTQRRRLGRDR